jgi:hypothetical protein
MQKLPTILGFGEFSSLSFQDLTALRSCVLKAMSDHLELSAPLPDPTPTRANLVGRFHHRALELASKAASVVQLQSELETAILALQAVVNTCTHLRRGGSVSGWDEINGSAVAAVRLFRARQGLPGERLARAEGRLRSSDGLLVGRPDYFAILGDSGLLKEFKSSSLRDEAGAIRREYEDQILFYAALLFDNFPLRTVNARLESMRGDLWERTITTDEARAYHQGVAELLRLTNQRIREAKSVDELETPSTDACSYCSKTVLCRSFKKRQCELELKGDAYVFEGSLERCTKESSCKSAEIGLKTDAAGDLYSVTIPAEVAAEMEIGHRYVVAGLGRERGGLRWTAQSRVFCGS